MWVNCVDEKDQICYHAENWQRLLLMENKVSCVAK